MISQETKEEIKKEALELYPDMPIEEIMAIGNGFIDTSYSMRVGYIESATKYAEKLEEKDKEIELLKQQATFSEEIESQLQVRIEQDLEKIESKDGEIEQLKVELEKCKFSHILTDESLQSLKEELDSKEAELAQLKEIAEKVNFALRDLDLMLDIIDPQIPRNEIRAKVIKILELFTLR